MGLRFRRTVSLGKGLRINFSGSGASLTLGPRGSSVNFSKRGTYVNFAILGTGLSYRTKIDDSGSYKSRPSKASSKPLSPERQLALATLRAHSEDGINTRLKCSVSDYGEIVFLFDDTGDEITDKAVLREVKRLPEVKANMPLLLEQ